VVTNSSKSLLPFHFHLDIPNEWRNPYSTNSTFRYHQ
jgi:hypothetical protein